MYVCACVHSDDWSAFEEFAASVEDPEEVVDAAAEVAAVEKEESVLVEQMSVLHVCVSACLPACLPAGAVWLLKCCWCVSLPAVASLQPLHEACHRAAHQA